MVTRDPLSSSTRRLVQALRVICLLALGLFALLAGALLVSPELVTRGGWPLDALPAGPLRWAALAIGVLLLAPPAWAAAELTRLSTAFLSGEVYAPAPARHLSRAGKALLLTAASGVAARPALDLLVGLSQGGGSVSVTIGSGDLVLLGCGLLLQALGRVLADAARLAAENRAFV
ncbi:DUF2975 domain-containing protein [Jannaschia aquimarina]|uniref:DUF2975 domain-containing protein n=1 Tax=Jannaschia aquimarina TaxID=935700 RepID=A0A0D1ELW0_9RHOB|nr:DUF2975 domain-containing protein [Jannaschia aquimarina]KIT17961.1 hypothetical protein jaqu_03180 [Jannaschia aquimarina]SNT07960.1 Protein of unknown function [Jannaschia aquimarina]